MESTSNESSVDPFPLDVDWQLVGITGGVIALLGALAIAFPFVTGLSMTYLLGTLLVASGIVHAITAHANRGWSGTLWQVVLAGVTVVAGLLLLANPILGLTTLTLLIIAFLAVDGLTELAASVRMREHDGMAYIAASGIISLVLAGLLWAGFPADATWAIGVLLGVNLLMTGFSMVLVSMTGRRAARDVERGVADSPRT